MFILLAHIKLISNECHKISSKVQVKVTGKIELSCGIKSVSEPLGEEKGLVMSD